MDLMRMFQASIVLSTGSSLAWRACWVWLGMYDRWSVVTFTIAELMKAVQYSV